MSPGLEDYLDGLRRTPLFRQLVPHEAGIGWPWPTARDGKVYVAVPFFGMGPRPSGGTALSPPFAAVTVAWPGGTPVHYVNFRFQQPWTGLREGMPVGEFPHPAVAGLTVGEYRSRRSLLLRMYDSLLDLLMSGQRPDPGWESEFSRLLQALMEPSLAPYYLAWGGEFFGRYLDPA